MTSRFLFGASQPRRCRARSGGVRAVTVMLLASLLASCLSEQVPAPSATPLIAAPSTAPLATEVPSTAPATTSIPPEPTATPAPQASRPIEELDCPIGTLTPCETQTLYQAISLTGTGYALHYASDRATSNSWDARAYGLGGWMLSVQHAYDPKTQTLYLGYGDRRHVERPVGLGGDELAIASTGGEEVYIFNATGRHLRTLDALTGVAGVEFGYDDGGRLAHVKDRDGNQTTIERAAPAPPTAIVGPFGSRTTLSLDTNGYLLKVIDPADESVSFVYTSSGLLTALTDPEGNVSRFDYDALGRLDREELPDGSVSSRSHASDGASYTITLKTSLLRTTTYTVERQAGGAIRRVLTDPGGARVEELIGADGSRKATLPDGMRIQIQWGPDPRWGMQAPVLRQLTQTTPGGLSATIASERAVALATSDDPFSLQSLTERLTIDGQTSVSEYDAATRTLRATSAAGRTSVAVLDAQGRVLGAQAADFARASYSYDARGRLMSIGQGEGDDARDAALAYDDEQGAQRTTDSLSRTQELRFDASGRVSQAILPGDRRIGFGYDGRGNLTAITPPGREAHSVEYTATGLPSAYLPPRLGGQDQPAMQTYDADGQLTTFTRPDGRSIHFAYDNAGRLSRVTLARGEIAAVYDPTTSYLSSLSAPGNLKLAYSYDGVLPTGETWSGPIAGQVGWVYDNRLRVASQSVGGDSVVFAYDADDLLVQAGDLALSRDPKRGLVTGATLGSVASAWEYNPFGEPISYRAAAGDQELYAVRYGYDKLGRISQLDETIGGEAHAYAYTYDAAGRLAEVRRDEQIAHSYGYDANGNRLNATTPNSTANGVYDAQDRLTQYGDASYTYTASGELLSKTTGGQTTGYKYDELGNLLAVTLPDGRKLEYLVDGRGRRVGKLVNGVLAQGWLYQDGLRPAAELDGAGNLVSRFVYASGRNVPDYMLKGGATYRILTDHLGSPRLVVDAATGAVAQRMDYDAFGNVTQDSNPGFQPFGFAGGLYDRDTGLVRFGARDYDAQIGRWTAKDPIGFAGGDTNLYGYVGNNPITIGDPHGLAPGEGEWLTSGDAAIHAMEEARRRTFENMLENNGRQVEFGGYIYLNRNGYYSYTEPQSGSIDSVDPGKWMLHVLPHNVDDNMYFPRLRSREFTGEPVVGIYHTHPDARPPYLPEELSGTQLRRGHGDTDAAELYNVTMYLGTPRGQFLRYDPRTDQVSHVRRSSCFKGCATITGEPHLRTLDGYNYDFQAVGEFVALRSTNDDLQIQVRQAQSINLRTISLNKAIAMNVAGDRVGIYASSKSPLLVNGRPLVLTGRTIWLPSGASIEKRGNSYTVTWSDRSAVQVDHRGYYLNITLSLPESRRGALAGLLGNFDGDPQNDLATRDGAPVNLAGLEKDEMYRQLYKVYGDSWRITQEESLFDYGLGEDTSTFTDLTFPDKPVSIADLDEATRKAAEQTCRSAGVTDQPYLDDCILDVGLTGDADFAQGAAQVIAAVATPTPAPTNGDTNTSSDGGQIAFGETVAGALAVPTEAISYTLTAKANDTVVAHAVLEGNGSFEVFLFDPREQKQITCNYVGCRAPSDGAYSLQLRYHDTGGEQPPYKYSLFVDRANDPVNAQPIGFGQLQTSVLDTPAEIDSYTLTAQANDMVVANIQPEGNGSFDAYLFDPRQHLLTKCNSVGCLAKSDGIYHLQIRSRNAAGDALSSRYTFFLERANNPSNVQPIAFGQTVTGALSTAVEIDSFALTAEANSIVTAKVVGAIDRSFELFLYDSQEQLQCTFNEVGCLAKTDGIYHLQVRYRNAGGGSPPYQYTLFVDRATSPVNAQPIAFGQILTGELASAAEIDSYTIAVRKNDLIVATIKPEGDASFDLRLFSPQEQQQYRCGAAGCRAPSDGMYHLQVYYRNGSGAAPPSAAPTRTSPPMRRWQRPGLVGRSPAPRQPPHGRFRKRYRG